MKEKGLGSFLVMLAFLTVFTVFFGYSESAYALPDSKLSYQGRLTNSSGNTVSDGTYNIVFSIYTSSTASDNAWSETQSVTTKNGIFSVILGDVNPITLDFNSSEYYLGIKVGSDSEMSPRTQIGASPFSINSKKLDGKNAGTGADDILVLDSAGAINIGSAIKTATYLQADDGLNVSGGIDFSGATLSSNINLNNHNLTSINTISGYGSNSIKFDIGGTNILEINSSAVKILPSSGVGLNVNNNNILGVNTVSSYGSNSILFGINGSDIFEVDANQLKIVPSAAIATVNLNLNDQSITNATYIEAGAGQDLDLAVDGVDALLIHNTTANVEIMTGNLLLADHYVTFDGNSFIGYETSSSDWEFDTDGNISLGVGATERISLGYDVGGTKVDIFSVEATGVDVNIPAGGSYDMNVNGADAMYVDSLGMRISNNVYVDSAHWIGIGPTDANLLFTKGGITDTVTVQNANFEASVVAGVTDNIRIRAASASDNVYIGDIVNQGATGGGDISIGRYDAAAGETFQGDIFIGHGGAGNNDTYIGNNIYIKNITGELYVQNGGSLRAYKGDITDPTKLVFDASASTTLDTDNMIKLNASVYGNNRWTGADTGATWAVGSITVSNIYIETGDLVLITPTSQPQGSYWVSAIVDNTSFTVSSSNAGENMSFSYIIIKQ